MKFKSEALVVAFICIVMAFVISLCGYRLAISDDMVDTVCENCG